MRCVHPHGGPGEHGFALIEVLVSAALVVVVAVGVLAGFDVASHASGTDRARQVAAGLAQQDQERLRAMTPTQLANPPQEQAPVIGGTTYTITSSATQMGDPTQSAGCGGDVPQTSYLKITSSVTWPRMRIQPVVASSLVAVPPSPTGGKVVVQVQDRSGNPESGINMSLSPGGRTATSTSAGCVVWDNVPAGSYTVAFTNSGYVEAKSGLGNPTFPITVAAKRTTAIGPVSYDRAAVVTATFTTTLNGKTYTGGTMDRITALQNGMSGPRRFGTAGTRVSSLATVNGDVGTSPGLFPFTGRYNIYAGDCAGQEPAASPNTGTDPWVALAPGDAQSLAIPLPPVDLTVQYNNPYDTNNPGWHPYNGAVVMFTPTTTGCSTNVIGPFTTQNDPQTGAAGRLGFPGLRYGTYNACAAINVPAGWVGLTPGWYSTRQPVTLRSPAGATATLSISMSGGTPNGSCP